ncbi:DUF742 domain-containing protein [Planomonospora venezuelensis]|uniref:DUF742 domain-containing protein n=1 Tax=Planomonospora venezuelensis TaxID=1999 RepID=A0A841D134_PLAVE|nr:DUF742 domain-containing protein [Planomonospora venezuelensis]MBB5961246.1 hypothetical protein [Planomonospora venezuelensis]GIM99921.1 hypothetical protein Pve01_15800 [Planomonospora venezuelensis]
MTERWMDQDAGPIVRPYTVTRGRTRPRGDSFDLIATVSAIRPAPPDLPPEHRRVLAACRRPISVAEAASTTGLAVGVVQVLLGDLRDSGLLTVRIPAAAVAAPRESILRDVLAGLRAL